MAPVSAEQLEATAENPTVALVSEVKGLVSPPGVFVQLQNLMTSDTASAADFSEIISRDPSMTAKVLKLSNSAYFGLRARVDTVSRAVTVIGMTELYTLALSVSAVRSFSNLAGELVNMGTFWRHSVLTATIARKLAKQSNVLHPERLFVAGLLHDIGYLVLFKKLAPAMQDLLLMAQGDEEALYQSERDTFGFSHADVAAELFSSWSLPESIVFMAANHHEPIRAGDAWREVGLVALADRLAVRCGIGALFE
ncbi:MAG: HDOD domain-containing protein, partial [Planctomycetota bacterium]